MAGKHRVHLIASLSALVLLAPSANANHNEPSQGGVWPAIRVNFELEGSKTPCGYVADVGKTFDGRKGLRYGWNFDHTDVTRDRGIVKSQLKDTLSHFHEWGKWEIEVPDGWHEVHVGIGDAGHESTHSIYVEGQEYWDDLYLDAKDFRHMRRDVLVTDGRLTIHQGNSWDKATRINFVEIDAGAERPSGCGDRSDEPKNEPKPDQGSNGPKNSGGGGKSIGPRPYGLKGLKKLFGRRCNTKANNARTYYPSAGGRGKSGYVYYHSKLAGKVGRKVLGALKRKGKTKAVDYGVWGYACRMKTGGSSWSVHSWGAAIDTNTLRNPFGARKWDGRGSNGKRYHRTYPKLWLNQGFYWGINFSDPMHFQYVSGY